jgi:hypothetical protein
MISVKKFESFDPEEFGDPWIAKMQEDGSLMFGKDKDEKQAQAGGYTGGFKTGNEGELFISSPEEGAIYVYGQKNIEDKTSNSCYVIYLKGRVFEIDFSSAKKIAAEEDPIEALDESYDYYFNKASEIDEVRDQIKAEDDFE